MHCVVTTRKALAECSVRCKTDRRELTATPCRVRKLAATARRLQWTTDYDVLTFHGLGPVPWLVCTHSRLVLFAAKASSPECFLCEGLAPATFLCEGLAPTTCVPLWGCPLSS